jgi:hypothetical protein
MAWYTIKYPNGTFPKQPAHKGDYGKFTDEINRSYKYISIPFLERANYHDKERLKGCAIVNVNTGEIVEWIRVYNKLLEGLTVLRETEKAILTNTNEWIPKSQCEVFENGQKIYVSDWLWKTKFENKDKVNQEVV